MKNSIKILLLVVLILLILILLFKNHLSSVTSNTISNQTTPPPVQPQSYPITISGTIKDENNQPLSGIVVSVNRTGAMTDSQGRFYLVSSDRGFLGFNFDNPKTGQQYEIANTNEQGMYVSMDSKNIQKDFILKPI